MVLACRGREHLGGDSESDDETDAYTAADEVRDTILSNTATDFYVAFSTVEGYVAYRNSCTGTHFLQIMCDVWNTDFFSMNIDDLMKKVKFVCSIHKCL